MAGERFHLIPGVTVVGDVDLLVFVAGAVEDIGGVGAPRAAGFYEELEALGDLPVQVE